jgi:hypothetical protein
MKKLNKLFKELENYTLDWDGINDIFKEISKDVEKLEQELKLAKSAIYKLTWHDCWEDLTEDERKIKNDAIDEGRARDKAKEDERNKQKGLDND